MVRELISLMLGVVTLIASQLASAETTASESSIADFPELRECASLLNLSAESKLVISEPMRNPVFPNRTVRELTTGTRTRLTIDATTHQVLHFFRPGEKLNLEEMKMLGEGELADIASRVLGQLAPDANLGQISGGIMEGIGGQSTEAQSVYGVSAQHFYQSFPCRARGINLTVSRYSGKVLSFTNLAPVAPRDVVHIITSSAAESLAREWVSRHAVQHNIDLKSPSLEVVIPQKAIAESAEEVLAQMAWVVWFHAGLGSAEPSKYFLHIDANSGEVFESNWSDMDIESGRK